MKPVVHKPPNDRAAGVCELFATEDEERLWGRRDCG